MNKKIESIAIGGGVTSFVDVKDKAAILDFIYPVGSIFFTMSDIDLNTTIPYNSFQWEKISKGKYLQATDANAGSNISAGLPNITGFVHPGHSFHTGFASGGVFQKSGLLGATRSGTEGSSFDGGFTFDASRSSAIYGRSSTVTPESITVYMWKRIK